MKIKVKRLKWAGNYVNDAMCRYHVEHTSAGKFKAESPTFGWYPSTEYNNKKAAMEACQRHYAQQVINLLELEEDEL